MAPDIALYEKEKKRKGPIWGGERAANEVEKQRALDRSSSPATKQEEEEFSAEDTPNAKRQRLSLDKKKPKTVPIEVQLVVTGYSGWVNNVAKEDSDKKKLRELGIHVIQDARKCSHLAAPNLVRTKKFLCALAMGPTIISTDFIEACSSVKKGGPPDIEDYVLKDTANEKKFGLKLKDVVQRAKANKRSLLRPVPIYCTKDIPNGPETYKEIVEANGGHFALYTGKPVIRKINPEEDDAGGEPVYLVSGDKPSERRLWTSFIEMAEAGNMEPRIVTTDWLLDVAMSQQLKWDEKYMVGLT
ncbi:putative BRCT-containing protein 1 [Glarea lozoyensis 74030]|nr:putative BRCT-containing protein 1 [Glarea lozoyensis 74030]